ncbi:Uncharacterised protein [Serratia plymuthica]|uniref:Uncharacterized protein n=1 Tax=Serratia plymuthica TaxID=82996 RepID=A0A2X4UX10_SERPL|nr:Uncharacterised protein [Serratia plymuthica]
MRAFGVISILGSDSLLRVVNDLQKKDVSARVASVLHRMSWATNSRLPFLRKISALLPIPPANRSTTLFNASWRKGGLGRVTVPSPSPTLWRYGNMQSRTSITERGCTGARLTDSIRIAIRRAKHLSIAAVVEERAAWLCALTRNLSLRQLSATRLIPAETCCRTIKSSGLVHKMNNLIAKYYPIVLPGL